LSLNRGSEYHVSSREGAWNSFVTHRGASTRAGTGARPQLPSWPAAGGTWLSAAAAVDAAVAAGKGERATTSQYYAQIHGVVATTKRLGERGFVSSQSVWRFTLPPSLMSDKSVGIPRVVVNTWTNSPPEILRSSTFYTDFASRWWR
jgi:hypothetical protein